MKKKIAKPKVVKVTILNGTCDSCGSPYTGTQAEVDVNQCPDCSASETLALKSPLGRFTGLPTQCLYCDGTGQLCDDCGEAEGICDCGTSFSDCPDCDGTGE